ncbi:hypothetical protein LTR91_026320 [Friedmanniomyces endolithicus]|uniref:2EXR domain-containing protein n=1 Tax=Friedmanniomyces endolithicus TaxID=329885 RepID=A0AAN6GXQ4_9PEZI|nr:hypothetical protein LTR91_026320 [Friedmanniomyces endolithicus]
MANSNIANSNTVTVWSGEPAYTPFATVMAHHKRQEARQSPPNAVPEYENGDRSYCRFKPLRERPAESCQLLRLPPELREMIWAYVLVESQPKKVYTQNRKLSAVAERRLRTKPGSNDTGSIPIEPALTSVCNELRKETLDIFWTNNTFKLIVAAKLSPARSLARRRERPFMQDVILRFNITYTLTGGADVQHSHHSAELGVKLDIHGKVTFSTMAWLDQECVCRLIGDMYKYLHVTREVVARTGLLRFAIDFGLLLCQR